MVKKTVWQAQKTFESVRKSLVVDYKMSAGGKTGLQSFVLIKHLDLLPHISNYVAFRCLHYTPQIKRLSLLIKRKKNKNKCRDLLLRFDLRLQGLHLGQTAISRQNIRHIDGYCSPPLLPPPCKWIVLLRFIQYLFHINFEKKCQGLVYLKKNYNL